MHTPCRPHADPTSLPPLRLIAAATLAATRALSALRCRFLACEGPEKASRWNSGPRARSLESPSPRPVFMPVSRAPHRPRWLTLPAHEGRGALRLHRGVIRR